MLLPDNDDLTPSPEQLEEAVVSSGRDMSRRIAASFEQRHDHDYFVRCPWPLHWLGAKPPVGRPHSCTCRTGPAVWKLTGCCVSCLRVLMLACAYTRAWCRGRINIDLGVSPLPQTCIYGIRVQTGGSGQSTLQCCAPCCTYS